MKAWLERAARARARLGDPLGGDRTEESSEVSWRRTVKQRLVLVLGLLGVWAVVLQGRLLDLQVLQHGDLLERAKKQQLGKIVVPAVRGDIVDRNGQLLAYSVDGASIDAAPDEIKDDAVTAAALCQALGDCTKADVKDFTTRFAADAAWTTVRRARTVTPDQIAAVKALELKGIYLTAGSRRWYPRLGLASHLIGYVGLLDQHHDNRGLAGVESKFDSDIRGSDGWVQVQYDAKRQRMATRVVQAPTSGATLELTIDLTLQYAVERELQDAVDAHHAKGAMAVVMNPMTGEILAMASVPTFNPNAPGRTPEDPALRNRAVQEVYEPGSTFKIVTASAALEEGVFKTTDLIDTRPGFIKFGRRKIDDDHPVGIVSFEDVIVHSSNVGAIMAGQQVGAERLGRYIKRFGFGERLAPHFAGESKGVVFDPARLDDSGLASVSMGYQVSVTPLQMANAVSAIANGGRLLEPHLVRATVKNGVRTVQEPKELRQAIAPATAATMTSILEEVVRRGTARAAALERYQVAGKTGTAKKVVNGAYSDVEFNASFVGFAPSRRPEIAVVVVIDTPRGGRYYGGQVAAPVFRRIAEAALRQLGVPPTINPAPAVVVSAVTPPPGLVSRTAVDMTPDAPVPAVLGGVLRMPDVRGLSGRAAVRLLNQAGLTPQVTGDGIVVDQSPAAGTEVSAGARALVRLSRGKDGAGR